MMNMWITAECCWVCGLMRAELSWVGDDGV